MKTIIEAKVFKNGGSNAIRLPKALGIDQDVLFLEVDDETNDVVIHRTNPQPFAELFAMHEKYGPVSDEEWPDFERSHEPSPTRASIQELIDAE